MLSRRQLVAATLGSGRKRPFVLVHGAWHGAFCWRPVERLLRAAGHEVFSPTLTGLADRAHLLTRQVNLDTHLTDVTSLLQVEDLTDVVLVGHSYGGIVITGAGTRQAARINRLVYLDAFIPNSGQSGYDLMPKYGPKWRERVKEKGEGWLIPPMLDARSMGIDDPAQQKWLDKKLTPHPSQTFDDALTYDQAAFTRLPKTFLRCARYAGFAPFAAKAKALGFEGGKDLDCGHDAMLAAPELLAGELISLA